MGQLYPALSEMCLCQLLSCSVLLQKTPCNVRIILLYLFYLGIMITLPDDLELLPLFIITNDLMTS